jgi:very-short-patch-repair endonuclease
VLGLSATIARKDGHHPIIFMQCGPVRHRVNARAQAAARPLEHYAVVQPTSFRAVRAPESDRRLEFQRGVRHLVALRAGLGKRQRQAVADRLASIPSDEPRVILATGKYVGEGFDDPRLDTLFLTLPVSWRGTIAQYAGRLHRLYDGKREVRIHDYADLDVAMLARMFDRRCRGYEAVGYTALLPRECDPRLPADVILPSDPVWKRDYSGSVRRLVRDGVDTPLASLFVHVARTVPPDADGAHRARSSTEAFLFRRLETLAETKGRFSVNVTLPIPFDDMGNLEVDLLCADARVAVELDGAQHLADPVAYRRDRRKDQLLQEDGYLVLRFLAEDVGKELGLQQNWWVASGSGS